MQGDREAWLRGGDGRCAQRPAASGRTWRLVLLGPPGVGKGSQAELLGDLLRACPLSMGDVFRSALSAPRRTPAIAAAVACMERGELVPDETVLEVLVERRGCLRCRAGLGFLLDGFPRTVAQADALERLLGVEGIPLDAVLSYELPVDTIVARLAGRRVCPGCKAVYHLESRRPRQPGQCHRCPTALVQRADDQPEAIRTRMAAHEASARPVADFYRSRGLLSPISAEGSPQEILARTMASAPFAAAVTVG